MTILTRRNFVAVASAAAAAIAASGCSSEGSLEAADEVLEGESVDVSSAKDPELDVNSEGRWIPASCSQNCGGGCCNYVYVRDNLILRQKTDDTKEDSIFHPQQRSCLRGRSGQQMAFSAERIKYPMKRKNWNPGGSDVNGDLRGKDEWERISWDEAVLLVADEIKRVYQDFGPRSVYLDCYGYNEAHCILNTLGGCIHEYHLTSFGTWKLYPLDLGTTWIGDMQAPGGMIGNDRFDLVNADTIIMYGGNPGWAASGNPMNNLLAAKEAGVEFIYVGPSLNISSQALGARWIPVRPGTDTAFLLGVAYVMITEDDPESNPLIDWDFLNRCTVGFDLDHLPEDATVEECFKDYVLGEYDGIPKTPEWASEICGTPVEDIIWYAEKNGCTHNVMILSSYAAARCFGAEDFPQIYMTVGCMGGHLGKSGNACHVGLYHWQATNNGPRLVQWGPGGFLQGAAFANPINEFLPVNLSYEFISAKKYFDWGVPLNDGHIYVSEGKWRDLDVRLMLCQGANWIQTGPDIKKRIEAYRSVETVISMKYDFDLTAQYSDIILPLTTAYETPYPLVAYLGYAGITNREMIRLPQPALKPLYEAKSDYEIGCLLVDALGIDRDAVFASTPAQAQLDKIVGAQVLSEDGETYETLVTIEQEDLDRYVEVYGEATCEFQKGKISLRELMDKGVYQVERKEGDNYGFIGYQDFRDDPEANPRPSKSGKIEIYCQTKADGLNAIGYTEEVYKPYATYHIPVEGFEASFADYSAKTKGDYPYQMFTPHYYRRSHTCFDNHPWLREAMTNPAYLNRGDAQKKGIAEGDTVLIWNASGKVLRHACLLDSVMPGCIAMPHGPWSRIDAETGIDYGGNENNLCSNPLQPTPVNDGFNTTLVNYEKYDGEPIPNDCDVAAVDMPDVE